ncbi:MAG: hypothetical protein J4428_02565 [Candidatus Aenigmarchaeota archaeon]|nr:hypothetical protein [Candidatus Aenigmarchaeota archaeon]
MPYGIDPQTAENLFYLIMGTIITVSGVGAIYYGRLALKSLRGGRAGSSPVTAEDSDESESDIFDNILKRYRRD